jgi:hypothetical protein
MCANFENHLFSQSHMAGRGRERDGGGMNSKGVYIDDMEALVEAVG